MRARALALDALERHRDAMRRCEVLLRASRVLCERAGAVAAALPEAAAVAAPPPQTARARCGRIGCDGPALFRPCFVVEAGGRRVRIDSVPLAVCAVHRDLMLEEFRSPSVLASFRHKVLARRGIECAELHVWFQTLQ